MQDHQDALEAYSRGLEYLDYNEPDQAIRAFTEALKLNPRHVHAYFARGCAWIERGNLEQAIADYNEAIRLDPNYAAAYTIGRPLCSGAATPRPLPPIWNTAGV